MCSGMLNFIISCPVFVQGIKYENEGESKYSPVNITDYQSTDSKQSGN